MSDRIKKWAEAVTIAVTVAMAAVTIGGATARMSSGAASQNEMTVWAAMAVATLTLAIAIIAVRAARQAGT